MNISMIVPCAGSGKRMGKEINKLFLRMKDEPHMIIEKTILALKQIESRVDGLEIILVIKEDERAIFQKIEGVKLVVGGEERQHSVYNGLLAVDPKTTHVLIHDGARPFVTDEILNRVLDALATEDAVCVGVPTKDTLKIIDPSGHVVSTPDRSQYWNIQTPQGFKIQLIKQAYEQAFKDGFLGTDDASLVERLGETTGVRVKMVMGSYGNIKVTTEEDLR